MTGLELLFLVAVSFGLLLVAAATPESYRAPIYIFLMVCWVIVLVYLMAPQGLLDRPLLHWMK